MCRERRNNTLYGMIRDVVKNNTVKRSDVVNFFPEEDRWKIQTAIGGMFYSGQLEYVYGKEDGTLRVREGKVKDKDSAFFLMPKACADQKGIQKTATGFIHRI